MNYYDCVCIDEIMKFMLHVYNSEPMSKDA